MPTIRKSSSKNVRKTTARRTTASAKARTSTKARTTASRTTAKSSVSRTPAGYPVSKFNAVRDGIQARVGSFRNIFSQVSGSGKVTAFSPRTAQQWVNLVNKGACVYKFNNTQIAKVFGAKFDGSQSNTVVTKAFQTKFGKAAIKGITRGRGNSWLVATNSPINKGPFKNYTWK